jgi:hypothetical protein
MQKGVSLMGNAVVAFVFPEPEDHILMGEIVRRSKEVFQDMPDVKVHLAIRDAADTITFFVANGELPTEDIHESPLVNHAERELNILGEDPETIKGYLKVIQAFSDMGHSGASASIAIPTINELLNFKNLCSLTDDPDEWIQVKGEEEDEPGVWQSKRNPEAFSPDGGKNYYLLSEGAHFGNPHPLHATEEKKA